MQCSLQLKEVREDSCVGEPQPEAADCGWGVAECDSKLFVIRYSSVCLNLEDLKCFEVVEHQFRQYGVTFKNAIALQPSNPAYPPRNSTTVLMAAPKSGWLEVIFSQPVSKFCCYVTSSQRMIMSAYDPQNLLISKLITEPNLAGSDAQFPPNFELKLDKINISRITFYAFDGQLTITDLSFGF